MKLAFNLRNATAPNSTKAYTWINSDPINGRKYASTDHNMS